MNRKIKFRVWLDDFQQYVYPHRDKFIYIRGLVVGVLHIDIEDENGIVCSYYKAQGKRYPDCAILDEELHEFENYSIQMFTGLVDSNGNEIYEGDILHYVDTDNEYDTYLICYYEKSNAWYIFCEEDAAGDDGFYWLEIRKNVTLFGNIHEHAIPSSEQF